MELYTARLPETNSVNNICGAQRNTYRNYERSLRFAQSKKTPEQEK